MAILIKSGTLITASEIFSADILVEGERIIQIGERIEHPDARVIDASGKLILPGGVDPHTHFDLPMFDTVSSDDHYTGHKAAAFGGTTTVIDFIPQEGLDLFQSIDTWWEKADRKAAVDYSFHMNISQFDTRVANDIPGLVDLGITSLKVFTAYNNRLRLQDDEIFQVMRIAKDNGMLTMVHAENGDVIELLVREALLAGNVTPEYHAKTRPPWGAVEATFRATALAAQADSAVYIVHMNVAGEVDQLKYARECGLLAMGETCLQYLFFTEEQLQRSDGTKWVCSPPLRKVRDINRLWKGVKEGTIQVISTDHCPFFFDGTTPIRYENELVAIPGKELGKSDFTKIPNGVPGVGDRLPLLWTYGVRVGHINPNQFVALTSTNPAKIFGMYPSKGALLPGSDADIVIWDPEHRIKYGVEHAQHRTDYNLYEGWELVGFPEKVFLRGNLVVDEGKWSGKAGSGKYIHRLPGGAVL
jgi:dihydropyrimidinase